MKLKRIHLFEFEDFRWFPEWLRDCLTNLIVVMHKMLGTHDEIASLINQTFRSKVNPSIVDLCSGGGGPMIEVTRILKDRYQLENLNVTLTDLFPNQGVANEINLQKNAITYTTTPVDATKVDASLAGTRTMICSFHHMTPEVARNILRNASESNQPICIYEISDNRFPTWLWWAPLPINFLMALIITPMVRPLTLKQIIFTYLVPIIPIFFAWDGAVSNARTYTLKDLDILLEGLQRNDYNWQRGTIEGKVKKLYLLGMPMRDGLAT